MSASPPATAEGLRAQQHWVRGVQDLERPHDMPPIVYSGHLENQNNEHRLLLILFPDPQSNQQCRPHPPSCVKLCPSLLPHKLSGFPATPWAHAYPHYRLAPTRPRPRPSPLLCSTVSLASVIHTHSFNCLTNTALASSLTLKLQTLQSSCLLAISSLASVQLKTTSGSTFQNQILSSPTETQASCHISWAS